MMSNTSTMYRINRIGPMTEPCGTPNKITTAQRDSHHVEPVVTFLSGMTSASREPCLLDQNWTAYTWHSSLHYFFLQAIPLRCTSYGNSVRSSVRPSVSPSVCLSHADIVSKRLHTARCSLHCQIAKCVCFLETKTISTRDDPFP